MSRGMGKMQRSLMAEICLNGKPMTFEEIRASIRKGINAAPDAKLRASFERSLRRALHTMTNGSVLIAMGDGGRGEPFRYLSTR